MALSARNTFETKPEMTFKMKCSKTEVRYGSETEDEVISATNWHPEATMEAPVQIDNIDCTVRENSGAVADMPATIKGSEDLIEISDIEPVTKCQSVKMELTKKQEYVVQIVKVPKEVRYHQAAQAIMKFGMEELADLPTWQTKVKWNMRNNVGAEGSHEQECAVQM